MKKLFILVLVCTLLSLVKSFPNFGMNKPHLLFHLGDRSPISLNIGWGYWSADGTFRLHYKNTNDKLYVKMNAHDAQTTFQ